MSVQQITADTVLAAIRSGAHTRADIAEQFGALSTSRYITDALADLAGRGLVVDEDGRLTAHGEQLTIDEEI